MSTTSPTDRLLAPSSEPAPPDWLLPLAQQARASFQQTGLPSRRDEAWRYTNLRRLAEIPFVTAQRQSATDWSQFEGAFGDYVVDNGATAQLHNGFLNQAPERGTLPAGVIFTSLAAALNEHRTLVEPHLGRIAKSTQAPLATLNTAFLGDGLFFYIPANTELNLPVHLMATAGTPGNAAPVACHPRVLIVLEKNARCTVVHTESGRGVYFSNTVTEVVLGQGASLTHVTRQLHDKEAFSAHTLAVHQARDSHFTAHALQKGGMLSRADIEVDLLGPGAHCALFGLSIPGGKQHTDTHACINHRADHTTSRQLYKGILRDASHAVFNGRVLVTKAAQQTDAQQGNHNLLLSDKAQVDSKPELEIYADDVKCAHGATVGQLDQAALFYLRSRGLDVPTAYQLLTDAFGAEVVEAISDPTLRQSNLKLSGMLHDEFAANEERTPKQERTVSEKRDAT